MAGSVGGSARLSALAMRKPPLVVVIWLAIAFACAARISSAGWASWNARERAIERATVTSQNLTRVLGQHTERMIDSVDMLLKMVAQELGPDARNAQRRNDADAKLAYLTRDLPHVMALRVLDGKSGEVLFDFARARLIGEGGDLVSVQAHRAGPLVPLAIGTPLLDPLSKAWMLPVSRRIGGREGVPGNIVVAYLSLDYLQRFLAQLEMGPDGSVTLIRTDGIVVARRPYRESYIGSDVSPSPLFSAGLWKAPNGTYETVSVADGIPRIFSFRRIGPLPLIITVGVPKDEVTAAWLSDAKTDLVLAFGAVVILLTAGAFLSKEVGRRASAESALSASEERLRLALRAGRMVAWERDAEGFVTRSENAPEVLGLGSGPFSEFLEHVQPQDRDKVSLAAAASADASEYRFTRDDGTELWLATRSTVRENAGERVVGITFDITDRKLAEEQAWRAAHSDVLTGLANRAFFQTELAKALRQAGENGGTVGLLLLDLDDFKTINDSYGHDAGDALLMEIAARINRDLGSGEFAARLGGDEFAVVLRGRGHDEMLAIAESMLRALQRPIPYNDLALSSRASIGIALYPDHDKAPAELMKDADMALYAAKSQGRSRVVAYAPEMRQAIERRSTVVRNMLRAVADRQIVPYYQPKICLSTGKAVGFEALARWRHPEQGLLTPAAFGSAFEDPELAIAIGRRMLEQMTLDIREWLDGGLECGRVALNLSTAEFREPGIGGVLLEQLAAAGVPTSRFCIEVTETVFLGRSAEHVAATLKELREAGMHIALDDFGTGYASLTHLKQFPVDEIKIDRTFVRDMERDRDDNAIVSAVIGLGRSLGMMLVAEGVETPGQAESLRAQGCHFAQGYLFAKPMAASRVPWFLSQPPARRPKAVSSAA
ncbi:MAG: putative sensory box/GGDEF family protein [Microvirga sp.]|jgi:diguanylate cyclase (GGDEF)-like protein|nr:putative sensory box/GGDEF family protein [Microvirga sp.]